MTGSPVSAAGCSGTTATGSAAPIAPEHVIQLAVRAAEAAETLAADDLRSNVKLVDVWPVLAADACVDVDGEPQANVNKNSDARPAARIIGLTCCNGGGWGWVLARWGGGAAGVGPRGPLPRLGVGGAAAR